MPMSESFASRLEVVLPKIVEMFGTPFHVYDEVGILETGTELNNLFQKAPKGFREYFAVKACPNFEILKLMRELGFGFDCSSIPELKMCELIGARGEDIMFTSNNTSQEEYREALRLGAILNLDDISFVEKVPEMPELICFRYNPGDRRTGNDIIGEPMEAKYGVPHEDIEEAYRLAMEKGAKRFGIHTMVCSNELENNYIVTTVRMLLDVVRDLSRQLDITFEFINMGGGLGIPYRPGEEGLDLKLISKEIVFELEKFQSENGYVPKLFMESGRYITGPHGVLVTSVLNTMKKYRDYVGVDACMSSLMRPALYGAYHHITVLGKENSGLNGLTVDVVGSLCENNDKFAIQRNLPLVSEGDVLIIHDAGAHGHAMGFNYNARLRPKELLLLKSGKAVQFIREEETFENYIATQQGTDIAGRWNFE